MRVRHGILLVLGLFVLGALPLLLSFSGQGGVLGLQAQKNVSEVALSDEVKEDAPLASAPVRSAWPTSRGLPCPSTDLRVLVLAADGKEANLPAIREALDYLGTPYAVIEAAKEGNRLTRETLSDGCRGFYSGIVLTTGNLAYDPGGDGTGTRDGARDGGETVSALSEGEWETLATYEERFGVRRAALYAYPTPEYGLEPVRGLDTTDEPLEARLTPAGAGAFGYLNPEARITVRDAFAYESRAAGRGVEPVLEDGDGDVLGAMKRHPGGRETLALTFGGAPRLLHTKVLAQGVVEWVTEGLYLGERRTYVSAQVDDVLIPNALALGGTYRMNGGDLRAVIRWQDEKQADPLTRDLRLDMAFNAYGTTGLYTPDTLTPLAREREGEFKWINHTYKHLDLDEVDYATALSELRANNDWARQTGLSSYHEGSLVTPEYSGLENPEAMRAAREAGIRYVVGDESIRGYDNPSPNAGFPHPLEPSILVLPRYANNLFFDVSTPEEWTSEYNERFRDYWGRDLSYEELLDRESDVLLSYLLQGDINSWMFHQSNLRAYDGERTLLGDLLDATLEKYAALYDLPVLSPTMKSLGERVSARMAYDRSGVQASVSEDEVSVSTNRPATVPVTGLDSPDADRYGETTTSRVELEAGEAATLPLN